MVKEKRLTKAQKNDPVVGGLMGLAVGDAFGVPFEFLSRKKVNEIELDEMIGCDSEKKIKSAWGASIPTGSWSDDTSLAIAEVDSIIENKGEIDYDDIMERFLSWWNEGAYSSFGYAFDIGNSTRNALDKYQDGYPALMCGGYECGDNGNGSLMRIFPFAIRCIKKGYDCQQIAYEISDASAITHAHGISKLSCFLYTLFLMKLLETHDPKESYKAICFNGIEGFREDLSQIYSGIAVDECSSILNINPDEISENGYVVNSLKVAIYSIVNTNNYEDAVKMAVRFGYDTDTNAAIVGSLAGVLYGYESIPERWLEKLKRREYLEDMAVRFSKVLKGVN